MQISPTTQTSQKELGPRPEETFLVTTEEKETDMVNSMKTR